MNHFIEYWAIFRRMGSWVVDDIIDDLNTDSRGRILAPGLSPRGCGFAFSPTRFLPFL